jgi:hypothetical protein
MDHPTAPIAAPPVPTAVIELPSQIAAVPDPSSRAGRPILILAAVAAAVALLAGGIALGTTLGGPAGAPAGRPTATDQLEAPADSVAAAVADLGISDSLQGVVDGDAGPAGVAAVLEEVIARLEAAAAAGPDDSAVTQGLRDLASALRGAQRALAAVPTDADPSAWTAVLPLLLSLLQEALADAG